MKCSDDEGLWTMSSAIFEHQPGEDIEYEPLERRDSSSSRFARGCSLASKTVRSVLCPSGRGPGEEDEGEHVLEAKEASDDELEAEYQEAVAMITIAKQRRAKVDRARRFFQEPRL